MSMQIKVFHISVADGEREVEEMNKFLRSHRILQVDRNFAQENGGYWSILVTYQDPGATAGTNGNNEQQRRQKVDWKEELSEEVFARFERLREIRSGIAKRDGVAAFIVFSDRELAKIAALETVTEDAMQALEGVDAGKKQKYGHYFLTHEEVLL